VAALVAVAGGAYGGYHFTRWNSSSPTVTTPAIDHRSEEGTGAGADFDEVDGRELFTVPGGGRVVTESGSRSACRLSCRSEQSCRGFEFNSTIQVCRVFSQIVRSGASASVYSGIKNLEKPLPVEISVPAKQPSRAPQSNFDEGEGRVPRPKQDSQHQRKTMY
jgi:PAN domain